VRFEGTQLFMAATDSYRLSFKQTGARAVRSRTSRRSSRRGPSPEASPGSPPARRPLPSASTRTGSSSNRRHVADDASHRRAVPRRRPAAAGVVRGRGRPAARRASRRRPPRGRDGAPHARLRLRFAEGELTISAQSQDVGETVESLPAAYTGDPLEIGFNAEFLADGVDAVRGDTVRLKLINPLLPD